jgi:hypothetical protein
VGKGLVALTTNDVGYRVVSVDLFQLREVKRLMHLSITPDRLSRNVSEDVKNAELGACH